MLLLSVDHVALGTNLTAASHSDSMVGPSSLGFLLKGFGPLRISFKPKKGTPFFP